MIKYPPDDHPDESQHTSNDESPPPAPFQRDGRHNDGGDDGANGCSGIEQTGSIGPVALGKPFCDDLHCCGKVSCFTQAKDGTCCSKTSYGAHRGM